MNVMDFFRPQQAATPPANQQQAKPGNGQQPNQQQQQPNNGQNPGNIAGPGTMPNQNNQNNGNNQNTQNQGEPTGIDKFSKMFDNDTTEGEKAPTFNLDPKILKEVAGSQDFMQGIDPGLMEKATSGDTKSLMQLMNNVAQNAYRSSLEHGSTLTDRFVGAREGFSSKQLGNKVRGELTTSALSAIPNYKHPAVQRQLKTTAEHLQKMHPDSTPQEIVAMTIEYHQELANAMNPEAANKGKEKQAGANKQVDWDSYFAEDQQLDQ